VKYVILRNTAEPALPYLVIMGAAPITHLALAQAFAPTYEAVSAGFTEPEPGGTPGRWRTFGHSVSLRLGPAPGDAILIQAYARATARSAD
jgi:hypothetical protein